MGDALLVVAGGVVALAGVMTLLYYGESAALTIVQRSGVIPPAYLNRNPISLKTLGPGLEVLSYAVG